MDNVVKKLLPENRLPEGAHLYDYLFNGRQLVRIADYFNQEIPQGAENREKDRVINRGTFYLTDEIIHYNLILERTL